MPRLTAYSAEYDWVRMRSSILLRRAGSSKIDAWALKMLPMSRPSRAVSRWRVSWASAAAASRAWRSRAISSGTWSGATVRWAIRTPSVSSTRAGPMAAPGETGMPRLISIRRDVRWASSDRVVLAAGGREDVGQRADGLVRVVALDLQDQLGAGQGDQQQQFHRALAVGPDVAVVDGHVRGEAPGGSGEPVGDPEVQPQRVGHPDGPPDRAGAAVRGSPVGHGWSPPLRPGAPGPGQNPVPAVSSRAQISSRVVHARNWRTNSS